MSDELPEWARITSDLAEDTGDDFDGVPLPVASPGTVAPSRPGRPRPQPPQGNPEIPVPTPVPTPEPSAPPTPDTVEQPAPHTHTEPQAPAHRPHTLQEPPQAVAAPPEEADPPPGATQLLKPKKNRKTPRPWGHSTNTENPAPQAQPAKRDRRTRVIVLRIAVWGVLAIVALAGLRAIIAPPQVSVTAISDRVAQQYDLTTFPVAEGEAIALAFARAYLTYSPDTKQARTEKLAQLVTPGLRKAPWLQEESNSSQNVAVGPYLLAPPSVALTQYATYKVAVAVIDPEAAATARKQNQILNPSWVYLSIPIYWATNGGVAVSGPPAFMPGPPEASETGSFDITYDNDASQSARVDLTDFFAAWGESDSVALARYTTEESTAETTAGLGGTVGLVKVQDIQVQATADPLAARFAQATVTWNYNGVELLQGYRLDVVQDAEGRWYVLDITGGDFPS